MENLPNVNRWVHTIEGGCGRPFFELSTDLFRTLAQYEFWILPVEVLGSGPKMTVRGALKRARHCSPAAGTPSEAEAAIEKGIDVARRQNAKSRELRGATSLARLRRQQGRPQEAVALLAPILGWFEEGFDTADLKEAKALLDNLG